MKRLIFIISLLAVSQLPAQDYPEYWKLPFGYIGSYGSVSFPQKRMWLMQDSSAVSVDSLHHAIWSSYLLDANDTASNLYIYKSAKGADSSWALKVENNGALTSPTNPWFAGWFTATGSGNGYGIYSKGTQGAAFFDGGTITRGTATIDGTDTLTISHSNDTTRFNTTAKVYRFDSMIVASRCSVSGKVALAKDTVYYGVLTSRSPARLFVGGNIGDTAFVVTRDSSGVNLVRGWMSRLGNWHKANGDSAFYGTPAGGPGTTNADSFGHQLPPYYSLSTHNHTGTYLLLHASSDNSAQLQGKDTTFKWPNSRMADSSDYNKLLNKPSIPAVNDSASASGNAWKIATLDTTTFKAHVLTGKAASATIADSTNGGAAKLNGKAATLYMDSTQQVRTARVIELMVDSVKVIAAKRTAIALTGILATDRCWAVFADSTSGNRKRGLAAVCKANSLIVHCDTTAATVNYMIYR